MKVKSAVLWQASAEALIAKYRDHPVLGRNTAPLLPRLVAYTREDKAAKGLRSLNIPKTAPEVPIHFTALEMVQEERCLMLIAPPGAGKTSFALHLALNLAGELIGDSYFGKACLAGNPVRNAEGDVVPHGWQLSATIPYYIRLHGGITPTQILAAAGPGFAEALTHNEPIPLLILDEVESLSDGWWEFAAALMRLCAEHTALRILLLGDKHKSLRWPIPDGMVRHSLQPLPRVERQRAISTTSTASAGAALGDAAGHAGLFALARDFGGQDDSLEAIIDAWHSAAPHNGHATPPWLEPLRIAKECVLRDDVSSALALFRGDQDSAAPAITSLLARWHTAPALRNALVEGLMLLPGDAGLRGALLAAEVHDTAPELHGRIRNALHQIVRIGGLAPIERVAAGRKLSQLGDPRNLEALIDIPGGIFTMGCASHPNSSPVHSVAVAPFCIGAYPVTNASYAAFVAETERHWASPHGRDNDRANMPATDLTWYDARAYCGWLTEVWRKADRISRDMVVRLPSEPEWERASRGNQGEKASGFTHPWGSVWDNDCANGEALGLNDICAVGIFPRGCSPYGCYDMAGQVWEWCSTLWGENMAAPSFTYPYRDDGRENIFAPDRIRRVLRGGCFSSGATKANATYRGSLEAGGFWRGNGFRIAVS